MSGTDSSPLPEGPASSPSVSSGAQEHGGADAGHGASEAQDNRAFEDALSFRAWDGESDADAPDGGGAALPAPSEAQPPTGRDTGESAAQDGNGDAAGKPMSLMGHLSELRTRLVRVLIVIILGFFACYAVAEPLFDALVRPLVANMPPGSKLIFTAVAEAFFVYMKVGFVASLFLTSPHTFYQIWAFVAPGLYAEERRYIVPLAAFSAFFFLAGAAFCYFVVFPMAFAFFMSYATDTILPMPSLDEYLEFTLKLLIAFGLIAEMPLFAFFLARIGVLTAAHLRRWRKYALLASVIIGALLTPPDVPSQLIMATVICVLYEASIWVVAFAQRRLEKQEKKQEPGGGAAEDAPQPAQEAP